MALHIEKGFFVVSSMIVADNICACLVVTHEAKLDASEFYKQEDIKNKAYC